MVNTWCPKCGWSADYVKTHAEAHYAYMQQKTPLRKHILRAGAVAVGVAAVLSFMPAHRVASANIYPNPSLSPGLIATSNLSDLTTTQSCGTYSQCHRNTTEEQKKQVHTEYPTCPTGAGQSEIDHIIPLALGGADDVKNLWCQPDINPWNGENYGYHTKDKLESFLVIQVKAGAMTPKNAQACIINDWVKCYQQYIANKYGSIVSPHDPDE